MQVAKRFAKKLNKKQLREIQEESEEEMEYSYYDYEWEYYHLR